MDVFVSYSRRDGEFVGRLVGKLQERGKDVWVDVDGIRNAEVFPAALRAAVGSRVTRAPTAQERRTFLAR